MNGDGVPGDPAAGFALLESTCSHGAAEACSDLATQCFYGWHITKDESKALTLRKRACDFGLTVDCSKAAVMLDEGRDGPADESGAETYFQKGCALGDHDACAAKHFIQDRVRPLQLAFVRHFYISHAQAKWDFRSKRSKAQARQLAQDSVAKLHGGADFAATAEEFEDELLGNLSQGEDRIIRRKTIIPREEAIFRLKLGDATIFEDDALGFEIVHRTK